MREKRDHFGNRAERHSYLSPASLVRMCMKFRCWYNPDARISMTGLLFLMVTCSTIGVNQCNHLSNHRQSSCLSKGSKVCLFNIYLSFTSHRLSFSHLIAIQPPSHNFLLHIYHANSDFIWQSGLVSMKAYAVTNRLALNGFSAFLLI